MTWDKIVAWVVVAHALPFLFRVICEAGSPWRVKVRAWVAGYVLTAFLAALAGAGWVLAR